MKSTILIFVFVATFIYKTHQCKPSPTTASGSFAPRRICSGELVFEDNFDKLDTNIWQHEIRLGGGDDSEFQWYTDDPANSAAENGILKIKPTLTSDYLGEAALTSHTVDLGRSCTVPKVCKQTGTPDNIIKPIRSAKILTTDSFAFKYGRVEIRAKLPAGDWLWPLIWMNPKHNVYGKWPRSGEIDILEARGNRHLTVNGVNIGVQQITTALYWGLDGSYNGSDKTYWKTNRKEFNENFHTYELLWTPDSITVKVDGENIGSVTPPQGGFWEMGGFGNTDQDNIWRNGSKVAPFDHEYYFIINLVVGGGLFEGYFPDSASNPGGKPWSNESPKNKAATDFWNDRNQWLSTWNLGYNEDSYLQIDYVRVYAL